MSFSERSLLLIPQALLWCAVRLSVIGPSSSCNSSKYCWISGSYCRCLISLVLRVSPSMVKQFSPPFKAASTLCLSKTNFLYSQKLLTCQEYSTLAQEFLAMMEYSPSRSIRSMWDSKESIRASSLSRSISDSAASSFGSTLTWGLDVWAGAFCFDFYCYAALSPCVGSFCFGTLEVGAWVGFGGRTGILVTGFGFSSSMLSRSSSSSTNTSFSSFWGFAFLGGGQVMVGVFLVSGVMICCWLLYTFGFSTTSLVLCGSSFLGSAGASSRSPVLLFAKTEGLPSTLFLWSPSIEVPKVNSLVTISGMLSRNYKTTSSSILFFRSPPLKIFTGGMAILGFSGTLWEWGRSKWGFASSSTLNSDFPGLTGRGGI